MRILQPLAPLPSMKHFVLLALLLGAARPARAQSVGIGTTSPAASAALEVRSTTQGVLLPRLTTGQMNAIADAVPGLLVFNTTETKFYGCVASALAAPSIVQNTGLSTLSEPEPGQSFTATATAALTALTVYSGANVTATYTMRVYQGAGFGGPLLGTSPPQTLAVTSGQAIRFALAPLNISLVAGQEYTFSVAAMSGTTHIQFSANDPYAGGYLYSTGSGTPGYDFRFRVESGTPARWVPLH
jgi:hypothetical protein